MDINLKDLTVESVAVPTGKAADRCPVCCGCGWLVGSGGAL